MTTLNSRFTTYEALDRLHRDKPFKDLVSSKEWRHFNVVTLNNSRYNVAVIPTSMEFRPDLIAAAAYGSKNLWWLVCTANAIIDPHTELVAGKQIFLPII